MTPADAAIDLDRLLAPIPGAHPTGVNLRYDTKNTSYDKIKAARRAADDKLQGRSADGGADDRLSPQERAAAAREYWKTVRALVTDALATQSKDLQLAAWLLEVEAYTSGFNGASVCFELIRRLLETYWDSIYPPLDDDDEPLAVRAGVLDWIDEKLPGILKVIPLSSGARRYTLAHYELAQRPTDETSKQALRSEGWPSLEQFAQAMTASSTQHLETLSGQLDACLSQLKQLEQVTDARFVAQGVLVSFNNVRKALEDSQFQVERAVRAKAPRDARPASSSPGSALPTDVPSSTGDGLWHRALQLVRQGQLEGLRVAQDHIEAASSGRERFLRQLQLSELCIQAGMHAFAYPILDELGKIIDQRDLGAWEDADLIRRTWSSLADVCKPLLRVRPESAARASEAQQRLSALLGDGQTIAADAVADIVGDT